MLGARNLKAVHLNDSGWIMPPLTFHYNDAGADVAKRDAYYKTVESDCKSAHPMASKISGIGRKPYTNCVNDRMAQYDAMVGGEKALADAVTAAEQAAAAETVKQTSMAAETQLTNAQTANIQAQTGASTSTIMAIIGILILAGGGYFIITNLSKKKPAVAVTAPAASQTPPVKP